MLEEGGSAPKARCEQVVMQSKIQRPIYSFGRAAHVHTFQTPIVSDSRRYGSSLYLSVHGCLFCKHHHMDYMLKSTQQRLERGEIDSGNNSGG